MEEQQQQMIPAIEPVRRMTETERLLMNELMFAQAAALTAQAEIATLKGAYQQQSQELQAAHEQIEADRKADGEPDQWAGVPEGWRHRGIGDRPVAVSDIEAAG